jgi:peptide/nickel transport system substrate-binding protein
MIQGLKHLTKLLIIAAAFASCYSGEKEDKAIFHYNETTGIASIDPAFAKNQSIMWAIHQLYNTLVEVDSSLHIVPSVAKRWEISEDKKIYTFYLRDDVFFHDDACFINGKGRRLIADDVVYSFNRLGFKMGLHYRTRNRPRMVWQ